MSGVIYAIVNTKTGERYIGQTTRRVEVRLNTHFSALITPGKKHFSRKLQEAFDTHGRDCFEVEVLQKDIPTSDLDKAERYWIEHFDSISKGYNARPGGGAWRRSEFSPLQEKLLSALRESGEPMTRTELGKAVGRKRGKLGGGDFDALEELAIGGYIVIGERLQGIVQKAITYQIATEIKIGKTTQGIVQEAYTYQRRGNGKS